LFLRACVANPGVAAAEAEKNATRLVARGDDNAGKGR
jgi:hypothetical protein